MRPTFHPTYQSHKKKKTLLMNNYLCEQKLVAKLRITFCHLDSQLKQFIRMKKCPITPADIITLFNTHYLSIYNSFISPKYIECSYEFQNFNWYANYKVDINESFWSKCWSTFIHRFSLETHLLINDTKTCYGNRIIDLWVQSVMDHFWLHIQFPDDRNDNNKAASSNNDDDNNTQAEEDDEEEEDQEQEPLIDPFRIQLDTTHKHKQKKSKKTKKKKKYQKQKTPSESSFDSDVS